MDLGAMELNAATHFGQGWPLHVIAEARELGVTRVRDEIDWALVERHAGVYDFSHYKAAFPDDVAREGLEVRLVVQGGNRLYDGGETPHTPIGNAAFARFVVAAVKAFPNVVSVEVHNEYNGDDFVTGPVREAGDPAVRARHHVDTLRAVYAAVKDTRAEVEVLGGAAHSVPLGYLQHVIDLDGLDYMDGIVIHPYTSPPEALPRQMARLTEAMGEKAVPIHATEFGQEGETPLATANYLVRMAVMLSVGGAQSADWYALREQPWHTNMELKRADGSTTAAGHGFSFVKEELFAHGRGKDVSPDTATIAVQFGDNAVVVWGAERAFSAPAAAVAYDARGRRLEAAPRTLSPEAPIILLSPEPLVVGENLRFAPQARLADTFYDFDRGDAQPWSFHAVSGDGQWQELGLQGGGAAQRGEPWIPYYGDPWRRPLAVTARTVEPVDFSGGRDPAKRYAVVDRYTAPRAQRVALRARWRVDPASLDGVDVTVRRSGRPIAQLVVNGQADLVLHDIALAMGETLDVELGPNETAAGGDRTWRRIEILDADIFAAEEAM